jgi:hypothetical protein
MLLEGSSFAPGPFLIFELYYQRFPFADDCGGSLFLRTIALLFD